jgi:hypothetical protein
MLYSFASENSFSVCDIDLCENESKNMILINNTNVTTAQRCRKKKSFLGGKLHTENNNVIFKSELMNKFQKGQT